MPTKVAVLLSGSGTTLQNLIDLQERGELDIDIVCVIGSKKDAYGLERARNHNIPEHAISKKNYASQSAFNEAVWQAIRDYKAELVVLAGYMLLLHVPEDYKNRIMNVHPALIPAFCGHKMYGSYVHEAVLAYGAKLTGATVHFVDEKYDHGPIILQEAVPVLPEDTIDTLADRVQEAERRLYPHAIRLFAEGRLKVEGRKVRLLPERSARNS